MPELPEVETTRRGLAPHLEGRRITGVTLRRPDLRWPIPPAVAERLPGQRIEAVERRAKYLLTRTGAGSALWHLGMSGVMRVLPADAPLGAHDHVDVGLDDGRVLRFTDPRRFGCLLWQPAGETHELLAGLGPEPLSPAFSGDTLFPGGPGNTSLPGGDFDTIIRSIDGRLLTLPVDTLVLPGHGLDTTVGSERPHLDEWVERGW